MSDFVDRLLGRSALAPIRPLLPSLFEPSHRGYVDESLPLGTFTTSSERAHDGDPARVLLPPQPAPPAETVTTAAQEGQRTHAPALGRAESLRVPTKQGRPDPVRAPSSPVARHRAGPTASEAQSRRDPEPPHRVAVPTPPGVSPAAPPPELPARRPAPPVVIEHSSHRTSVFERNVVASRETASEPDVHISIGRVEIVAAPPPPSPARHAHAHRRPQLTLDDYLKSREG